MVHDGSVAVAGPADDCRLAARIGREARLELVFGVRGDQTVLEYGYAEPPFRVSRPFEERGALHVMLTSCGPGIFGGDCLRQHIRVQRGARVRLTSQSSVQAHPGSDGSMASFESRFEVEAGARLTCQWLPLIPFGGALVKQRMTVDVAAAGVLYWSDAFMAGRSGMGERWRFTRLDHELRLTRGATLEYLERYNLEPNASSPMNRWTAGHCTYFGSTIATGLVYAPQYLDALQAALTQAGGVHAAVDGLGPALTIARLAAASGPSFHAARAAIDASLLQNL
jgi:urease accessory protein UreH